jgi:hypothetical protein
MKVRIEPESFYQILKTPPLSIQEQLYLGLIKQLKSGDNWQGEDSALTIPLNFSVVRKSVVLPLPFDFAIPALSRDNDFYSISIKLQIKGYNCHPHQSDKIRSQIPEGMRERFKDQWVPLDALGKGSIVSQGETIATISDESSGVGINIGEQGAVKRKFGSLEDFAQDMINLGKVTEAYVDSAVDSAVKEGLLPSNPDYTAVIG